MTSPIALDSSAAIPLLVASHPAHKAVRSACGANHLVLSGHALAETYSVLTRLPGEARLSAPDAVTLLDSWFGEPLTIRAATAVQLPRRLAEAGVVGGAVYDGMVALAALENGCRLLTRDARAKGTYDLIGVAVQVVPS